MFWVIIIIGGLVAVSLVLSLIRWLVRTLATLLVLGIVAYFAWRFLPGIHAPVLAAWAWVKEEWVRYAPWARGEVKLLPGQLNSLRNGVSTGALKP